MATSKNTPASIRNAKPTSQTGSGVMAAAAETVSQTLASDAHLLRLKIEKGLLNIAEINGFLSRVEVASKRKVAKAKRDFSFQLAHIKD